MAYEPYDQREYDRRIALGQTPDYARRQARGKLRGFSVQNSRGHHEGKGKEHAIRAERARAAGRATEVERAFARKQAPKLGVTPAEAIARFEKYTPTQRQQIIRQQRYYYASARKYGRPLGADYYDDEDIDFMDEGDEAFVWYGDGNVH